MEAMTSQTVAVCSIAALAFAFTGIQSKPEIAGMWVRDDGRTSQALRDQQARVAAGGDQVLATPPRPERLDLKLDGATLTFVGSGSGGLSNLNYVLDGKTVTLPSGFTTTAQWRGQRIEIDQKRGGSLTLRTEIYREREWLVIRDARIEQSATGTDRVWRSVTSYYSKAKE